MKAVRNRQKSISLSKSSHRPNHEAIVWREGDDKDDSSARQLKEVRNV